ncbi:alcohol dehydrogenase-like 3 [Canna indica]|uniref:Alcohol dehydrogenase-like 3 n=1 Tax=Canna indica TaxID=4628 RepID=A0AAQ3K0L1_9LILI|nr:alcohol dehydrogenase-like 3 [Canna indica]
MRFLLRFAPSPTTSPSQSIQLHCGSRFLREGDHMVPIFNGECGDCTHYKNANTNLCVRYQVDPFKSVMVGDGGTRFSAVSSDGAAARSTTSSTPPPTPSTPCWTPPALSRSTRQLRSIACPFSAVASPPRINAIKRCFSIFTNVASALQSMQLTP